MSVFFEKLTLTFHNIIFSIAWGVQKEKWESLFNPACHCHDSDFGTQLTVRSVGPGIQGPLCISDPEIQCIAFSVVLNSISIPRTRGLRDLNAERFAVHQLMLEPSSLKVSHLPILK